MKLFLLRRFSRAPRGHGELRLPWECAKKRETSHRKPAIWKVNFCFNNNTGKPVGEVQRSGKGAQSLKDESLFIKWLRVVGALAQNTKCCSRSFLRQTDEYK